MVPAQIGLAIASSLQAADAAREQAEGEAGAANLNATAALSELGRQQSEVQRQARAQKGDRASEADRERATLVALAAERGGGTLVDRLVGQSFHFESEDVMRLDLNKAAQIASIQAEKEAIIRGAINVSQVARRRAKTATTSAVFSGIGSGLQIASRSYSQYSRESIAGN